MTVTVASFRQEFDEFTDPGVYSDNAINGLLATSALLMDPTRWGNLLDLGASLYTAHFLVLHARSKATARAGGIPGATQGVLTQKSVDKVSASYNAESVMLDGNAGTFNSTAYGIRYLQLARLMGSGGMQFTGAQVCDVDGWGGF